jgi:O-succinylbenzoic acid--CoA ligase
MTWDAAPISPRVNTPSARPEWAALRRALAGGPPVAMTPLARDAIVPASAAVVVATSGSTGRPKAVALSASALLASAEASARRLGGTGRWLLALPTQYIAGVNVAVRCLLAGFDPPTMPAGPFTPSSFLAAWSAGRRPPPSYVSLVPTQLARLVAAACPGATPADGVDPAAMRDCLASFAAILVGGAAPNPDVLAQARAVGARVVETYGSAETCGGVVYDGVALEGTGVRLLPGPSEGRIDLSGPTLALGYVTSPADPAPAPDAPGFLSGEGTRWFRTNDLGTLDPDGRLAVIGRADDVLVTGGVKIAPAAVEHVLRTLPDVTDALVTGLSDPEWGTVLVALIVRKEGTASSAEPRKEGTASSTALREEVTRRLGPAAAPRWFATVPTLPLLASGKPDRAAAAHLAATLLPPAR